MKKYLIYFLPVIFVVFLIFYFLSFPEIKISIKNPVNFTILEIFGEVSLARNGQEINIKEIPFVLHLKDEINIKPFSGLTILCKNSSIVICHPTTVISIGDNFINLKSGLIEWKNGRDGIEIHFEDGSILYPSGRGLIEIDSKLTIISLKNESRYKIGSREGKVEELQKLIVDAGKLMTEKVEKPPVLLSPKSGEVYGDWKKDFGTMNVSIADPTGYDQYLFEVSSDPYFLSTMFSIFLKDKDARISLERIGTGKRYARVIPYKGRISGLPSESVEFFVKAFPLSKPLEEGTPPRIDIHSVILSGNIVIVKGKVDRECRLFVNKEEVSPEPNGDFNVPIIFKDIGEKWIEIEAISPNGLRSSKRQRVFLVGY